LNSSSSGAGKGQQKQESASSRPQSSPNSSSWTPLRALAIATFAGWLGYGYASYGQTPQITAKPQYGSVKDFEKVRNIYREAMPQYKIDNHRL
jgi:D-lactate dehydrogenase (cytochrome)